MKVNWARILICVFTVCFLYCLIGLAKFGDSYQEWYTIGPVTVKPSVAGILLVGSLVIFSALFIWLKASKK